MSLRLACCGTGIPRRHMRLRVHAPGLAMTARVCVWIFVVFCIGTAHKSYVGNLADAVVVAAVVGDTVLRIRARCVTGGAERLTCSVSSRAEVSLQRRIQSTACCHLLADVWQTSRLPKNQPRVRRQAAYCIVRGKKNS